MKQNIYGAKLNFTLIYKVPLPYVFGFNLLINV